MEKEKMLIDVNAHITNVSCQVLTEDGKAKAIITFDNLGYGKITAVKFNAKGYNSFGDVVSISGNETFLMIIQDISIDKNSTATNIKVSLPSDEIKKVKLIENQICFSDGTVTTYEGKKEIEFDVEKFSFEEQEHLELNALRDVFDSNVTYNLLETESGWICSCGRYNSLNTEKCSLCGHSLEDVKTNLSEEGRKSAVEKKTILDEQRKIEAEKQAEEKKKADKKKKIQIAIASVVALVFVIFIGNAMTMANRKTYSSAEAMKEDLQGTYTYYDDDGDAMRQVVISGNELQYVYKYGGARAIKSDIEWNPSRGTFETFEKWVVLSNGSLKNDGDVYKKGGYMSSGSSYSGTSGSSYESAYSALKISGVSVTSNSSYTVCTGTITNTGKKTYKFVQVKGAFKNSSGTTIDTDSTYAVGSEGLAPGESKTFRMSVSKNYSISKCSVSIYDYD